MKSKGAVRWAAVFTVLALAMTCYTMYLDWNQIYTGIIPNWITGILYTLMLFCGTGSVSYFAKETWKIILFIVVATLAATLPSHLATFMILVLTCVAILLLLSKGPREIHI